MNTPGWTPGPWQTRPRPEGYFYIEQATGRLIVAITVGGLGEEEKLNANLLAAAPELYQALRPFGEVGKAFLDVRERVERGDGSSEFTFPAEWVEWCTQAVSALAKARGESQ